MASRSVGRLFVPVLRGSFVYAGGVKLFEVELDRATLKFVDCDNRRALRRGTPFVEVKIQQLCEMLREEVDEEQYTIPDETLDKST